MGGVQSRRRRKRRRPDTGARLVPLEVDGEATDELFDSRVVPLRHETGEYVIDLPVIEKAAEPLPRRVS